MSARTADRESENLNMMDWSFLWLPVVIAVSAVPLWMARVPMSWASGNWFFDRVRTREFWPRWQRTVAGLMVAAAAMGVGAHWAVINVAGVEKPASTTMSVMAQVSALGLMLCFGGLLMLRMGSVGEDDGD